MCSSAHPSSSPTSSPQCQWWRVLNRPHIRVPTPHTTTGCASSHCCRATACFLSPFQSPENLPNPPPACPTPSAPRSALSAASRDFQYRAHVRRIRLRREGGEEEEKEEEKEGKEEKEEEKEEVEVQGGTNIRRWAMVYAPVV